MIVEEFLEANGKQFVKHTSIKDEKQFFIKQVETGAIYVEAIDILTEDENGNMICRFTYEETDIPVDNIEDEESD